MEEVVKYAVCWLNTEVRLEDASKHLQDDLQANRADVDANTVAMGEIANAITAIEEERIAYDFVGEDASQYFPVGDEDAQTQN